jgi:hypothetical protein
LSLPWPQFRSKASRGVSTACRGRTAVFEPSRWSANKERAGLAFDACVNWAKGA